MAKTNRVNRQMKEILSNYSKRLVNVLLNFEKDFGQDMNIVRQNDTSDSFLNVVRKTIIRALGPYRAIMVDESRDVFRNS